ncbi:MAG: polynucleotide adenylyltransferase PcnB [bacterium]
MDPVILPRDKHNISRANIDRDALKVLYRLHQNGYLAYLVGGSVRDLLLGRQPKDFDVVTDARPQQIKHLFRNAFQVGRRFQLMHITFRDKRIETSTFRKCPKQDNTENGDSNDLLLRCENEFGTPYEDASRRDFTINGLFYNIADFSVIDYVGGLKDLETQTIRSIGDPCIRFQEDPVRMIRAVRISGRTGFKLADDVGRAIWTYREHILRCSQARVLEEILQLLRHNSSELSMRLLRDTGLMEIILPEILDHWTDPEKEKRASQILKSLDAVSEPEFPKTPSLLLAALFLPVMEEITHDFEPGKELRILVEKTLKPFSNRTFLPRRFFDRITQISIAQRWFQSKKHKRFRPSAFVTRAFFRETLALASLYVPAEDDRWQHNRDKWRVRILNSDLSKKEKDHLLRLLQFKSRHSARRHRKKNNFATPKTSETPNEQYQETVS